MTVSLLAILGTGLVDPGTPVLRADDLGATRGDGCFEGCRVRTDASGRSSVDKLDAHLARMARSAAALDIAFDVDEWRDLVTLACTAWTGSDGREAAMKLVLTRGPAGSDLPSGFLTISAIGPDYSRLRSDGLRVITLTRGTRSDSFTDAPWLLGGVKTLSYAANMAVQREAERRGADDALFVSTDGWVLESSVGSVVWAIGRTLHTTPLDGTGILGGTTQQLLFERADTAGWHTAQTLARVEDLHAADVVWLIGSVRGPVDIVELDGVKRTRRPDVDAEIRRLTGF